MGGSRSREGLCSENSGFSDLDGMVAHVVLRLDVAEEVQG